MTETTSTCDSYIERETLHAYLYLPRVLSFVGGRQGSQLIENDGDGNLLEYAGTVSIVAAQRSFRTKFGKYPPMRNSIKQRYEKLQRNGCL